MPADSQALTPDEIAAIAGAAIGGLKSQFAPAQGVAQIVPPTVEEMKDLYRKGYVSAREYNNGLRRRATDQLDEQINKWGYSGALVAHTISNYQEAWNSLVKQIYDSGSADPSKAFDWEKAMSQGAKTAWKEFQLYWAPLSGAPEVASRGLGDFIRYLGKGQPGKKGAIESFAKFVELASNVGMQQAIGGPGLAKGQAATLEKGVSLLSSAKGFFTKPRLMSKEGEAIAAEAIKAGLKKEGVNIAGDAPEKALKTYVDYITKQARGVEGLTRPVAVGEATAAKMGNLTLPELTELLPGKPVSQEEAIQRLNSLDPYMQDMIKTARDFFAGDVDYKGAMDKISTLLRPIANTVAGQIEAGRGVQIHDPLRNVQYSQQSLRDLHEIFMEFNPELSANGEFDKAGQNFLWALGSVKTPQELRDVFIQGAAHAQKDGISFGQALRTAWTNLLLLPRSVVRKGIGDVEMASNQIIAQQLGGWLSSDSQAGIRGDSAWQMFKGYHMALKHTFGILGEDPMPGLTMEPLKGYKFLGLPDTEPAKGAAAGLTKAFASFRPYSTVMEKLTTTMQNLNRFANRYRIAVTSGERQGLEGEALADHITSNVLNPSDDVRAIEEYYAGNATAAQPVGEIGKMIQKFQNSSIFPGWILVPFAKTMANLTNEAASLTPGLQMISRNFHQDLAAGGELHDFAVGKMFYGQILSQLAWSGAKLGMWTGGGPTDPKMRQVWLRDHKPFSIVKYNDDGSKDYVSYSWAEPMSKMWGAVSDLATVGDYLGEDSTSSLLSGYTMALARDFTIGTYMETFNRMWQGVQQVEQGQIGAIGKALLTPLTSIPFGSLGRVTAEIMDPHFKDVDGVFDEMRANNPWTRKGVPSRTDPLTGEDIELPQVIGGRYLSYLSPFTYYHQKDDPVYNELDRLGVNIPTFGLERGKMSGDQEVLSNMAFRLTPQQREDWIKEFATIGPQFKLPNTRQRLERIINMPMYKNAPEAAQANALHEELNTTHADSWQLFLAKHPDVLEQVQKQAAYKQLPTVDPGQRDAVEQQYNDTINQLKGQLHGMAVQMDSPFQGEEPAQAESEDPYELRGEGPVRGEAQ